MKGIFQGRLIMKAMHKAVLGLALVVGALGSGSLYAKETGNLGNASSLVTTTRVYEASGDLGRISAWIKQASPGYTPVMPLRKVTIARTVKSSGLVTGQALGDPPVDLPSSGIPGEKRTYRNDYPQGSFESWTYEWVGGTNVSGWVLREYHFFSNGKDEYPPTQPF
ncbi:hypothetical protein [Xanthomonas nasturtii]|uniref:hypothetical protein n=1 Tax=Xanthomonas nasturtii TaxID=1843581 RepID=UPI0020130053|nr:hypothetical protein [Xanthomonas nasturtii]